MKKPIKVIDLFAGPGGLGEGFASFSPDSGNRRFRISLSIEKESSAHRTLQLRAFFRQFPYGEAPDDYYRFLAGELGNDPEDMLYRINTFKNQVKAARQESQNLTLGKHNTKINKLIREALTKRPGHWVLIGGPPCQAYSLAGRSRNVGIKGYTAENDHRNFLYREYLKIIARFRPSVFIMENVKGLLSAKIEGIPIFQQIVDDLHCPEKAVRTGERKTSYEIFSLSHGDVTANDLFDNRLDPKKLVIQSESYGVPQARHRVILLGIRQDLLSGISPEVLQKQTGPCIRDVISDLPKLRSGLSKEEDSFENWTAGIRSDIREILSEVKRSGLPDVAHCMNLAVDRIGNERLERGTNWSSPAVSSNFKSGLKPLENFIRDPSGWNGVCNHQTRGHIVPDLQRYLFCACYSEAQGPGGRQTPNAHEFPGSLVPKHKNWSSGHFSDRFRVQSARKVATTITSHISKDGHYFIHYDPAQCRSLTVREAARIQTFPDNYFFVGNRTQQYVQVGNAVPPFLAEQIAAIVNSILEKSA